MSGIRHHRGSHSKATSAIAAEAGKIMAEEGVRDFRQAKLKARDRLKLARDVPLPSNEEIQLASDTHLSLFTPDERIQHHRKAVMHKAHEAMAFFQDFNPLLIADFLNHPVTDDAVIEIHLQAQGAEVIAHFLDSHNIPFDQHQHTVRFGPQQSLSVPMFTILADEQYFNLVVLTETQIRQSPRAPVNGQNLHRINSKQVHNWLKIHTSA